MTQGVLVGESRREGSCGTQRNQQTGITTVDSLGISLRRTAVFIPVRRLIMCNRVRGNIKAGIWLGHKVKERHMVEVENQAYRYERGWYRRRESNKE